MRVTGNSLIDMASVATQKAEQQVATATTTASSGMAVQSPSDDPAAWAIAQRAGDRNTMSTARGQAIGQARDRMTTTDSALTSIANAIAQARTAAVEGSNGTMDADARAALAQQVQGYFHTALAAANSQTSDGEFVLAGSKSTTAPFDANGVYQGDADTRSIQTGEATSQTIGVPGSTLTAADGVDILPSIAALATALSSNNLGAIQSSITTLTGATSQLAQAQADTGASLSSLDDADSARGQFELSLASTISRVRDADPVAAASDLAKASNALDTAQAVASHVIALVQTPSS